MSGNMTGLTFAERISELARQIAEEQGNMHRSITSKSFSKSLSNSNANSNNPVCLICLQDIRPNSKNIFTCTAEYNDIQCGAKIHKKCVKENCVSTGKTYKRKRYINCPICNWSYFCKDNFEKTSVEINEAIKNR
tara:strand:- start:9 stop:413 length:405 start_codon:yes stop_codon:yes gene_type:complete